MRAGLVMTTSASAICFLATPILLTTFAVLPEGKGQAYGLAGFLCFVAALIYAVIAGSCWEDPGSPLAAVIGSMSGAVLLVAALIVFTIGGHQPAGHGGAYAVSGVVCLFAAGAFTLGSMFAFAEFNDSAAKATAIMSPPPVLPVLAPQPAAPTVTPPPPVESAPPPPPPPPEPEKPKEQPSRPFQQRDDRIRELVEASRSKDTPLDPMIVTAQLQDIEDDYRRQTAEETKA